MVEMTCEEHDRQAASTQFITHTVGRILGTMDLQVRPCSLVDSRSAELTVCVQRCMRRVRPWLAAAAYASFSCLDMRIAA